MIGLIKKSAFTLLEVIVSVAIFAVIVLAAAHIFQSVVSSQVKNFSETALQDESKYFLEVFTREAKGAIIRSATTTTDCAEELLAGETYTYNAVDNILWFKNKLGECVAYSQDVDANGINRLILQRGTDDYAYMTSDKIDIEALKFVVDNSPGFQPFVTINFTVKSATNPNIPALDIQTSVSPDWSID